MKKFISKLFILSFTLMAMSFLMINIKSSNNTNAEYIPEDHFNAFIAIYNKDATSQNSNYSKKYVGEVYKDNTAFLLGNNESVIVTMGQGEERENIKNLTTKLTINGAVFGLDSNSPEEYGLDKQENSAFESDLYSFILYINPALITNENISFAYGKYTIEFSYYYESEGETIYVNYSKSFFVLNQANYSSTNLKWNDWSSNINSNYYSFYNKNNLMYLVYDYKYVNVSISKSYQGLTTQTLINYNGSIPVITSLDEVNASTNVANISYYIDTENDKMFLTFKDLGTYYLSYTYINPYYQNEVVSTFFASSPINSQTAFVFGYQAFYTTSSSLEEFKYTNEETPYKIETLSNSADVTNKISVSDSQLSILDSYTYTDVAKTNQAPVYFKTNAKLKYEGGSSTSYYIYTDNPSEVDSLTDFINDTNKINNNYTGTPLTNPGLYFVCLNYTYDNFGTETVTQYFLFRITNESPSVKVYNVKYDNNGEVVLDANNLPIVDKYVGDGAFTYKDVYISKSSLDIFDTVSNLTVYVDTDFNGVFEEEIVVDDSSIERLYKTAYYKLVLSYGNDNKKGSTTYFTIDKSEISELEIKNVEYSNGVYITSNTVSDGLTSLPVAISWKEKASGATVYCDYKFFPTKYSFTYQSSISSNDLKMMYESQYNTFSIPSTHILNYAGGNIPTSNYSNTYGKKTLQDFEVLSDGGMYVFYIHDNTGAEGRYFFVFIDTTPNSIVSKVNDTYKIVTEDKMTSEDTTLYFGKYKLIKVGANSISAYDEWLEKSLEGMYTTYQGNRYIRIEVNPRVYFTTNTENISYITLSDANKFSYEIKAKEEQNGEVKYNESQYKFYTVCSTTTNLSQQDINSFDFYLNSYTASHNIEFTTDNSMLRPYYDENNKTNLGKLDTVTVNDTKYNYYNPTNAENIDYFYLNYCTFPKNGLVVESIIVKYYAFVKDVTNGTYKFDNNPSSIIQLYTYDGVNKGTLVAGTSNTYKYDINVQQFSLNEYKTAAGKYEIIRTYTNDSYSSYGNSSDPLKRNLTFIIDRNGIITEPDVDEFGNTTYYTGGGIFLQVVNNYHSFTSDNTLKFYDIYFASKLNKEDPVVLTTNLLPVTIYIPNYKYGYVSYLDNDNKKILPIFNIENSLKYNNDFYYGYKLSATVYYYKNGLGSTVTSTYNYNQTYGNTNFLTTNSSGNSIISYNQPGYYKVEVRSNAGDTFTFAFRIKSIEPNFELLSTENVPLTSNGDYYYTNKSKVRISWEDSESEFLAKINKDEIKVNVNNVTYKLDKNAIVNISDNRHYIDLDITNLNNYNAYQDGAVLNITLQFVGDEREYISGYFSKTVKLKIDLQAPIVNIQNLVGTTGLNFSDLRQYTKQEDYKYNVSKTSGLLKYYAFTVDISNYSSILKTPDQSDYNFMYYKILENKYINGYDLETNIETETISIADKLFYDQHKFDDLFIAANVGKYIELIEEDFAGNRTVYTIFITNIEENTDKVVITNSSKSIPEIKISDIQTNNSINLYNKNSFNLNTLDFYDNTNKWSIISVNNQKYVKSPFLDDLYYNLNSYSENSQNYGQSLSQITLLQPNSNVQNITIYQTPVNSRINLNVYVLNQALSYFSLSQIYDNDEEGILIMLPSKNAENILYATNLSIVSNKNNISSEIVNLSQNDGNAIILKEQQSENIVIGGLEVSYVSLRNATYVKLRITSSININDYFVYKLKDNFGETYSLVHIYGQTDVKEPITSEGYYTQKYDDQGKLVYYSSEKFTYAFNTTIYEEITISVNSEKYKISFTNNSYQIKDVNDEIVNNNKYSDDFEILYNNGSKIMYLTLLPTKYNFAENKLGGSKTFEIEFTKKSEFKNNVDEQNEKAFFEIFNTFPTGINLIGKESGSVVNAILNGTQAYNDTIVINYVKNTLKYDYEPFIMYPDGTVKSLTDDMELSDDGLYRIIINYLGLLDGCSKTFEFRINNTNKFLYSVVKILSDGTTTEIEPTNSSFSYNEGSTTYTISTHYILNSDYEIVTNSSLGLEYEEIKTVNNYTKIYSISNLKNVNNLLVNEYYSMKIAITQIPSTNSIISRIQIPYGGIIKEQTNNLLNNPTVTSYVTNKEQFDNGINITWSSYYLIPENLVKASIYYGDINGSEYNPIIQDAGSLKSLTIKEPGVYYIKFTDLSGNIQYFGSRSDYEYLTIKYVSNVIFEINDESPINYAIYDKAVTVSVPQYTLSYYDINYKPVISVELNGKTYTDYTTTKNSYSWTLSLPGVYKVWFSAKIDEKNVYETPIYFTILSSTESRLSFSYNAYNTYYIEDILKNGTSINSSLANINNGEMYDDSHLKNLSISTNDIKTGSGYYTFIINTDNNLNQKFSFTVWLNNASIPIEVSIPTGEKTTKNIKVKFNTVNLLSEAGDCILKITGLNNLELTSEKLADGKLNNTYEITLDKSGSYYIEVTTLSGKLLYSYFVVKTEPLNVISIIIISISTVVVVTGVVVFLILRKRMKIR